MLSKTSCSKLLRKNLTRFAPLWALYSLFLMLCIAICISGNGLDYWFVASFRGMMNTMPIFSCGYAFLTANLLFGDLYTPRMCYSLHAFPVKRDILFKANVTAGILAAVVPNGIFALVCAPLLAQAPVTGAAALAWWFFLASTLGYLFFFGTAVLCAMLAGNRLGHAALYGVVSLGGGLAYFLVDTVYTPMLYGVLTPGRPFKLLSPVVYMVDRVPLIDLTCESKRVGSILEYSGTYTLSSGWGYMAGMAALGLVLLGAALWLYRRRALEKAGDFLAEPPSGQRGAGGPVPLRRNGVHGGWLHHRWEAVAAVSGRGHGRGLVRGRNAPEAHHQSVQRESVPGFWRAGAGTGREPGTDEAGRAGHRGSDS